MECKNCGHDFSEHITDDINGNSCQGFYEYEDGCHTHQDDCPCPRFEEVKEGKVK